MMNQDEPNGLLEVIPRLEFSTEFKLSTNFEGSRAKKFHSISVCNEIPWDIRTLSILLNEQDKFVNASYKYSGNETDKTFFQMSFAESSVSKEQNALLVRVYYDWTIEVKASLHFLKQVAIRRVKKIHSTTGSQGRLLKKAKEMVMYQYIISKNLEKISSHIIYKNQPLLFCSDDSFGYAFKFFASHIIRIPFVPIPSTLEINFITDNADILFPSSSTKPVNSLNDFTDNTLGYIHLTLLSHIPKSHFQKIVIDERIYSIVNGIYISPYAKSILVDNASKVDGLMMDTTWRVISNHMS